MKVSEKTARMSIATMRSMFNNDKTYFPFVIEVMNEMEYMLEELIKLRKQNVGTKKKVPTKGTKNGN